MKKTRMEKGITLIALIITIVVLLILATVSISSIQGDGILSHTENSVNKFNYVQGIENDFFDDYTADFEESLVRWTQKGTQVTNGKVILDVGTIVTGYDETKDKNGNAVAGVKNVEWAVLGAESGRLLIVSTTNIQDAVLLVGPQDYLDEGQDLHNLCSPYGQGVNAVGARSIKVEDINRVTGYNPSKTGDGTSYGYNTIRQYGNRVTYKLSSGKLAYSSNIASGSSTWSDTFIMPDGTALATENDKANKKVKEITIKSTYYRYYPNTLTDSNTGNETGKISDEINALLFENTDYEDGAYWLASKYESVFDWGVDFGIRVVSNGKIDAGDTIYTSEPDATSTNCFGARPVVVLKSNVNIDSNGVIS